MQTLASFIQHVYLLAVRIRMSDQVKLYGVAAGFCVRVKCATGLKKNALLVAYHQLVMYQNWLITDIRAFSPQHLNIQQQLHIYSEIWSENSFNLILCKGALDLCPGCPYV